MEKMTDVKPVVPWLGWKVLPRRMPRALRAENVRTVMTAVEPSAANQLSPGPSSPDGQRMALMSVNPESVVVGSAVISAP